MLRCLLIVFLVSLNAFGGSLWSRFSNAPYQEGAFPEIHVSYFRYTFQLPTHRRVAVRIKGRVPHGRYMTFNLYDPHSKSSLGSLPDSQLVGDHLPPMKFPSAGNSYTLWLTPQLNLNLTNQIVMSPNPDNCYEIWYRIYLPDFDDLGGVPLPSIEFIDLDTKIPLPPLEALPSLPAQSMELKDFSKLPPRPTDNGDIFFYASKGFGFYNNGDNQYLVSRLDFSKDKHFVLLSFKAPTVGKPLENFYPDVRYFSFCMGSAHTTRTSGCISDKDMKTNSEITFLLIGPQQLNGVEVGELCRQKGINFLEKGKNFIPLLIYRNVLIRSGYPGAAILDFLWPPETNDIPRDEAAILFAQHHHIGSYAPTGKQMSLSEVLNWIESPDRH